MQAQGIAGEPGASVPSGSVSGLGVCDVWRLELSAVQWPWLLDELDIVRGALEDALDHIREDHVADTRLATADELSRREYELRFLGMMRAQLPPRDQNGGIVFLRPPRPVPHLG